MSGNRRALILGIGGQDGSYLADRLLALDYEVHGLYRRASGDNLGRIRHIRDRITLHRGDLTDAHSLDRCLWSCIPHEVYNQADQDHVGFSWETPMQSVAVTLGAVVSLLELLRDVPDVRLFQPISSTIFGDLPEDTPQHEGTRVNPRSPYAIAKAATYHACRMYRDVYNVWVATGILYNHDSPRRGRGYLLDDLIGKAQAVQAGKSNAILMGNPAGVVDLSHAADIVEAERLIMQLDDPDDFIVGSGAGRTVFEIADTVRSILGLDCPLGHDPDFQRPDCRRFEHVGQQPGALVADTAKLVAVTGWKPKYALDHLISEKIGALRGA